MHLVNKVSIINHPQYLSAPIMPLMNVIRWMYVHMLYEPCHFRSQLSSYLLLIKWHAHTFLTDHMIIIRPQRISYRCTSWYWVNKPIVNVLTPTEITSTEQAINFL